MRNFLLCIGLFLSSSMLASTGLGGRDMASQRFEILRRRMNAADAKERFMHFLEEFQAKGARFSPGELSVAEENGIALNAPLPSIGRAMSEDELTDLFAMAEAPVRYAPYPVGQRVVDTVIEGERNSLLTADSVYLETIFLPNQNAYRATERAHLVAIGSLTAFRPSHMKDDGEEEEGSSGRAETENGITTERGEHVDYTVPSSVMPRQGKRIWVID